MLSHAPASGDAIERSSEEVGNEAVKEAHIFEQADAYASPWSVGQRARLALWNLAWLLLFRPTPKFLGPWRVFLLRAFGCRVSGRPFVAASAIVKMPWNLVLEDRACLGDRAEVYNLGPVTLRARCTVAQHVYLCTGTHDLAQPSLPLVVGEITIGEDAFIGARALILSGVSVGKGAVVGAGAGVFKSVEPWTIVGGNPACFLKARPRFGPPRAPGAAGAEERAVEGVEGQEAR